MEKVVTGGGKINSLVTHKHIANSYTLMKFAGAAGVALMLMSILAGCESTYISTVKVPAPSSEEIEILSEEIRYSVKDLEYSDMVAEDFDEMVIGWHDGNGQPVLAVWKTQLSQVRNEHAQGRISDNKLARFEQNALKLLNERIWNEIGSGDFFELGDCIEHRQAQSLGYSQLVYILANSIGLTAEPIDMQELLSAVYPAGAGHTACLINLANGTTAMVDLTWLSAESKPFKLEKEFTQVGVYWELKNKNNPLGIHKRIQILDKNGFLASIYNNRGYAQSNLGRYIQAISEYGKAIQLNPNCILAYNNRGLAYNELDRHNTAITDYNKAIELNPNFALTYNNRASAFIDLEQLNKAIDDCIKAVTLNPEFAEAYVNRARANIGLEEYEKAIYDCNKALELNSQLGEAYINRAIACAKLGNLKDAKNDLLYAIAWKPALTERARTENTKHNLGLSDEQISDWSEGMILVTPRRYGVDVEVVGNPIDETSPEDEAHIKQVSTYDIPGRPEQETTAYEQTENLNPKDAAGYIKRGNAYYRLRQRSKAIADYNNALELNPGYVAAYYNRGNAYASIGQFEQAKSDFLRALELNPAITPNVKKSSELYKLNLGIN